MTDTVQPAPDEAGHQLVDQAEDALRAFAGNPSRAAAKRILAFWRHYPAMSADQVAAVFDRFPAPSPLAPVGGHLAWCDGKHVGECIPAGAS